MLERRKEKGTYSICHIRIDNPTSSGVFILEPQVRDEEDADGQQGDDIEWDTLWLYMLFNDRGPTLRLSHARTVICERFPPAEFLVPRCQQLLQARNLCMCLVEHCGVFYIMVLSQRRRRPGDRRSDVSGDCDLRLSVMLFVGERWWRWGNWWRGRWAVEDRYAGIFEVMAVGVGLECLVLAYSFEPSVEHLHKYEEYAPR